MTPHAWRNRRSDPPTRFEYVCRLFGELIFVAAVVVFTFIALAAIAPERMPQ